MEAIGSILVRATNWIGDCIISLPAVRELRRLYPAAKITVLARPWVADIYRVSGLADEVILLDRERYRGLPGLMRLGAELRRKRFTHALLLQNAFEAAIIARLAGIPHRIGYGTEGRGFLLTRAVPTPENLEPKHQSFYYLNLLTGAGLSPVDYLTGADRPPSPGLSPDPALMARACEMLASRGILPGNLLVGMHAGASYGPAKRWFPERFAAVADHLVETQGARVVLFGSSDELPIAERVRGAMQHDAVVLCGHTTLAELMALIAHCHLFISNDSGPMHLAAALQRPVIALFGSTDETATGPMSGTARVVHKQVECTPCFLRECPIDLRCFEQISVREVCGLADDLLHAYKMPTPALGL
jgi:heptosyltransferase-2